MDFIKPIIQIRSAFPKALHLLTPYWRDKNKESNILSVGFCYIGTEALFHMLGGEESGFKPVYLKEDNETHWWLASACIILDVTFDQYDGETPKYHLGKGAGYMNGYKKPSKRAKELIEIAEKI